MNIVEELSVGSIPTAQFDFKKLEDHISSKIDNFVAQYIISPVTVQETKEFIAKLSRSKAAHPDAISVKVLKLVSPVFSYPITRLFNLSIEKRTFSNKWKVARVTPLFKHGACDSRDNYRPISVLSVLSKLLEKHVAASFMNYLVKNGLLYDLQSAFRECHSTESALIKLTDQILFNLDQDKVTGMIFVDFRKAFDVVNHQLLLPYYHLFSRDFNFANLE